MELRRVDPLPVAAVGQLARWLLPRVEIVYSSVESANALVVETLQKAGARGIVFASTGAGTLSDADLEAMNRAAKDAPDLVFVRSSRTGNGRVTGRKDYDALGVIPADNLNPQKARVLLMLALAKTTDRNELRRIFTEY